MATSNYVYQGQGLLGQARFNTDMELVTSRTSVTCVKCSWAGVKFSRINAKNYQTRICQIQVGGFTK